MVKAFQKDTSTVLVVPRWGARKKKTQTSAGTQKKGCARCVSYHICHQPSAALPCLFVVVTKIPCMCECKRDERDRERQRDRQRQTETETERQSKNPKTGLLSLLAFFFLVQNNSSHAPSGTKKMPPVIHKYSNSGMNMNSGRRES